jgi:hypothetical protein
VSPAVGFAAAQRAEVGNDTVAKASGCPNGLVCGAKGTLIDGHDSQWNELIAQRDLEPWG